jgi:hypothetical protein
MENFHFTQNISNFELFCNQIFQESVTYIQFETKGIKGFI